MKTLNDALEEARKQYPGHCEKCDGYGFDVYDYDPSPSGVSLAPGHMTEYEACKYCYENNKCPRCGYELEQSMIGDVADNFEYICRECGWYDDEVHVLDRPNILQFVHDCRVYGDGPDPFDDVEW